MKLHEALKKLVQSLLFPKSKSSDVLTPTLAQRNNDSESRTDTINSFPNFSDVSSVDIINENEEERVNHVPQIVDIEDGDTDDEDLISSVRNIFIKTYRPKLLKKSHGHKEAQMQNELER